MARPTPVRFGLSGGKSGGPRLGRAMCRARLLQHRPVHAVDLALERRLGPGEALDRATHQGFHLALDADERRLLLLKARGDPADLGLRARVALAQGRVRRGFRLDLGRNGATVAHVAVVPVVRRCSCRLRGPESLRILGRRAGGTQGERLGGGPVLRGA